MIGFDRFPSHSGRSNMTSRERVLASLNHQQPDRVVVDLSGYRSSGISSIAYPKLRAALGLEPRSVDVYDPVQQLAIVHDDVLDRFGVDTIEIGRGFCHEDQWWAGWALPEQAGPEWVLRAPSGRVIARMPEGSLHFDQVYWPFLDGVEDLSKIEAQYPEHMWTGVASPPGPAVSSPAELAEGARALRANTDRAIVGLFGGNLLEMGQFYYRMDNFLMMLAGEPARVHRFLDALAEIHMKNLDRFLGAVGPYIDIIVFGDDLGAHKEACERQSNAPLLRGRPATVAGSDRRRTGCHQPGADQLQGDGCRGTQTRFRQGSDVLGWRLRHAANPALRYTGRSPRARSASVRNAGAWRRICLPASAQHPGKRAR